MPSVAPLHNKRNKHANLRDVMKMLLKLTGSNSRCEYGSSTTSQKLVSGPRFWAESKPGSLVRRRPQRRRSRIWFSTPDTVPYLPPQKYKILNRIIRYTKIQITIQIIKRRDPLGRLQIWFSGPNIVPCLSKPVLSHTLKLHQLQNRWSKLLYVDKYEDSFFEK